MHYPRKTITKLPDKNKVTHQYRYANEIPRSRRIVID